MTQRRLAKHTQLNSLLFLSSSLVNSMSAVVGHFSRTATAQQLSESVAAGAFATASAASAAASSAGAALASATVPLTTVGPAFVQDEDEEVS